MLNRKKTAPKSSCNFQSDGDKQGIKNIIDIIQKNNKLYCGFVRNEKKLKILLNHCHKCDQSH